MGHVLEVAVFDDIDHLREDLSCLVLREASKGGQSVEELPSFTVAT